MTSEDMPLVQEYAQRNSERAFATLVSRHANLIYSVAMRQVRDPHLAEEITQGVFVILARKAKSLSPKTILSGWLCRTARYVSANALRIQRRRQLREQESRMQPLSMSGESDSSAWNQIAPLLDEALNCLGAKEHDAVVLRFFDGKDLKQVGAAMGTTEDAARMRVNRGVERLRRFFVKKGVTLSAGAIAGAVAANSVQAAPAGLTAAVTTAALSGAAITTTTVIAATKAIAMTTLQKTILGATLAAAVGAGIYEARQGASARDEVQTLKQQLARLAEQNQNLVHERDQAVMKVAQTGKERPMAEASQRESEHQELLRLRGQVGSLRNEMAALKSSMEEQGLGASQVAANNAAKEYARETLHAMATLGYINRAYATTHQDLMPTNFEQLQSLLPAGVARALRLDRFEFLDWGRAVSETEPTRAILRERNPQKLPDGRWARAYLYADGAAYLRFSEDGNFDRFEDLESSAKGATR